ncbi:MAG: nitroreductase family protein [Nitriliruptorales bacterium]|nr:nitroreductase family protein [Nitriliruptorales bacterium]
MTLDLSPDELLTTTRAVRKRLDLDRPVEREVIEECIEIAIQAPTGSNRQNWHWVVVTEPELRAELAGLYREGAKGYLLPEDGSDEDPTRLAGDVSDQQKRVVSSARYLAENIERVPVHVIPCAWGRLDGDDPGGGTGFAGTALQAGFWGSIFPAIWNFQLALRARGLGSSLTTFHLTEERRAAELLGIPYDRCTQAALIPVAYSVGTDFKPANRSDHEIIHWNQW